VIFCRRAGDTRYFPGGIVNLVFAPDVYAQYRTAFPGATVLIEEVLQRDHWDINVVAKAISNM
jgi:hypothetical protein